MKHHSSDLPVFEDWQAVARAPRSPFFRGHTSDTAFDRARGGAVFTPSHEALFTQSNARILLGHAANGALRLVALPTQLYAGPNGTTEFELWPGIYYRSDVVMYAGDLSYQLLLDGDEEPVALAGLPGNETTYAADFLPLTTTRVHDLDVTLISIAPVAAGATHAPLAPAPLPGPAGALYVLHLHNTGDVRVSGKVVLQANDMLLGHYEDVAPELRELRQPQINLRQHTLILTRPEGAVGIHLHEGDWTRLEAPFEAGRAFSLEPGEAMTFDAHVALGASYAGVMPVIYDLHMRPALDWLNLTAAFWRDRLGRLEAGAQQADDAAAFSRDVYVRSLFDNFNCLQTDARGELVAHWQGAPSHGYGTVWGIDVEPTAVSVAHICPEIAWRALLFFMDRSRAPKGPPDHSVPILVAPVIIARKWLEVTGDVALLDGHPAVMPALKRVMRDLWALKAPDDMLFPTRLSSDGAVGRRYDYGTNIKVWYTFDSMAYLLRQLNRSEEAAWYAGIAREIQQAVERIMVVEGPFGPQISGGTNLGENPGTFYLPEGPLYYDGEDSSSMLAPVYGNCEFTHEPWVNYHRFARSLWCPNFDPEFGVVRWSPSEFGAGALDGTAFFSRLGGCISRSEMLEALSILREVGTDDVTGSVFWWPHGLEYKRSLTRCSQGQGAWAWQYLQQWLGLRADAPSRTLTLAPRGLLSQLDWHGFRAGPYRFDVHWTEDERATEARVRNANDLPWTVQVGFRQPGNGAAGPLSWQTRTLEPGEEATFVQAAANLPLWQGMDQEAIMRLEVAGMADDGGVIFRRFGPAQLWGHWEAGKLQERQAMPLTVRLLVQNGSGSDWSDVSVALTCPEGWQAEGRQPRHWTRPEHWAAGTSQVDLGRLPSWERTVAAFWLKGPDELGPCLGTSGAPEPFHAISQPGPGLTLTCANAEAPTEATLEARLSARTHNGEEVQRTLTIPLRLLPK
jgi:hypothetical protein